MDQNQKVKIFAKLYQFQGDYTTELKMSACKEGKFTCNDGQCVSMEERCNQLLECRDGSDEDNCNVCQFFIIEINPLSLGLM